jgi:HAD superfamily hydrolase (TIGR01509 family)
MIQAMIFDLDGTLVQTEKLKAISYAKAAHVLDPDIREEDVFEAFRVVVGRSRSEVARYLVERFDLRAPARRRMEEFSVEAPWQAYVRVRLEIYDRMLHDEDVLLSHRWPHTMDLLQRSREQCDKVGLATMSFCRQVRRVLAVLGLENTFDFVASRDDVENGKPDPEIYALVSSELEVDPAQCLVIEDSPTGVEAAVAAGMACIAVATPFTREALHEGGLIADRWIVDEPAELCAVVGQMLEEQKSA